MSGLSSFLHQTLQTLFATDQPWAQRLQTFESQVGHLPGLFSPTLARQLATDPQSKLPTDPQIWFEVWPLLPKQLRPFLLHCFAFHLPRMATGPRSALPPLADLLYPDSGTNASQTTGFDQLTLIWGLYQWEQRSETDLNTVTDLTTLNAYYARAGQFYPAYRLDHESLRAGWVHVLVSALNLYEKYPHKLLHPLLVNSLKALWNESRQQSQSVVEILQAVNTPALQNRWQSFRALFERHEAGLKAQHKTRQIQDELYAQWSQQAPITPPLQKALQRLLHEGPLGHVQTFIRQHRNPAQHLENEASPAAYLPQGLQPLPYGYRRENQEWTWRSHADFSDRSPRDQAERLAQQHFDQALIAHYQTEHPTAAHLPTPGIQGKRQVQSRWWSAGEALFIQALRVYQGILQDQHPPEDLHHHDDLYWCKDPALRTVFLDACERLACPERAGLQVSEALRHCAISFIAHLNYPIPETPDTIYDDTALKFDAPDGGQRLIQAMMRWSLGQVNAALQDISPAEQALYQAWARRQSGGVPIDGFCQPLLYEPEHPGRLTGATQTMTPAVLLWGTLHRPPLTSIPLPFVSRLHMHEVTPVSDLLRYWASYALLGWRQQFQFLQTQQKKREAEYERIQRAFHAIQKHREAENRAWADLRNQLDPPELLAYGVASTYALNRSYSRLHRPEQIESAQHLPCFLAELATGKAYTHQAEALDTLTQIHQSQPQTLIAELYDYWQNLPPEQRTTLQAQKLFNYCKMVVYDGSQIEGQLPGKLSLMQVIHTLHRVQQNYQSQQRTHLQGPVFQLQGEKNPARNLNTLPLKRLLSSETLQQELMGQALHQIPDTHRIWPCFRLGVEETALRWMSALYALCTVHFAPPRPGTAHPEQALYLHSVQLKTSERGLQLQICLNGHFSTTARHTLETLSTADHAAAHDLRNTLYTLREASGVAQGNPWFKEFREFRDADPSAESPAAYFQVAETTQLMVNLPL